MRQLHITNDQGKDTCVNFAGTKIIHPSPKLGKDGEIAEFLRYLAAAETGNHEYLAGEFGEDYSQALIDSDPEVDMELVGRRIGEGRRVYIEFEWDDNGEKEVKVGEGKIRHAPPKFMELLINPDGTERERREPEDIDANINDDLPLRWTGKKLSREKAVKRFVMSKTIQLFHRDGLTYDYLFNMAEELSKEDVMMLIGAGNDGNDPLIFQANGSPYRGFLEGRVNGTSYKLLLHLSNLELKSLE